MRHKRIARDHALGEIFAEEHAGIVAADTPSVVWVRSLVPKEKNCAVSAISPARKRGARQLDHGADHVSGHFSAFLLDRLGHAGNARRQHVQFGLERRPAGS